MPQPLSANGQLTLAIYAAQCPLEKGDPTERSVLAGQALAHGLANANNGLNGREVAARMEDK